MTLFKGEATMKKFFAVLLIAVMVFTFAACGGESGSGSEAAEGGSGIDMSAYPSDINEWTGQNFIDYFKAQGLFTDDNAHETWLQDHASYWPGTPVSEMAGWWDLEGTEGCVMIAVLKPDLADSSQEDYDSWMEELKTNKMLSGDAAALGTVDHMVGNVVFAYSLMTLDDDCLTQIEEAYAQFLADTGFTEEF